MLIEADVLKEKLVNIDYILRITIFKLYNNI